MSEMSRSNDFDFDAWVALGRADPEAFERLRAEFIERFIEGRSTDKERSRRQQCRIDLERRRAKVPLKACLRLSNMMWESVDEMTRELNRLRDLPAPAAPVSAQVLPFACKRKAAG